jgi:hypothetical protein
MMNDMAEMLEATGVKNVRVYDNTSFPGMGIPRNGDRREWAATRRHRC